MAEPPIPNILSIAGSDPSGGAGIQADLKAISANGGYGMAVVTALTAQNTRGVRGVRKVEPSFVADQIDAVFEDIRVDAVKIGMLADAAIAEVVAAALTRHHARHIVLDPVMVAKGGDRLLDVDAIDVIARSLVPRAEIVTPNLPEAVVLLSSQGHPNVAEITERSAMPDCAAQLIERGARGVLLKGGHLPGATCPDLLAVAPDGVIPQVGNIWFESRRHPTPNTHGTGCTLSSALATHLALEPDVRVATSRAVDYVQGAIRAADRLSVGPGGPGAHGPTHHFFAAWGAEREGSASNDPGGR